MISKNVKVGDKVVGFNFENADVYLSYNQEMVKYEGQVGEVVEITSKFDSLIARVQFDDGYYWFYPIGDSADITTREKNQLFYKLMGQKVPTELNEEAWMTLEQQAEQVLEEAQEMYDACVARNIVKVLDGQADVRFTNEGQEDLLKGLGICTELPYVDVCDNNLTKFLTDKQQAAEDAWELYADEGGHVTEVEVDGITYYPIRDKSGKLRKPSTFKGVELGKYIQHLEGGSNE